MAVRGRLGPHQSCTTSTSSRMDILPRVPFHSRMVRVSRRRVKRRPRPLRTQAVVSNKFQMIQHDRVSQCSRKGAVEEEEQPGEDEGNEKDQEKGKEYEQEDGDNEGDQSL